jgi:hypothetical protein
MEPVFYFIFISKIVSLVDKMSEVTKPQIITLNISIRKDA